MLLIFDRIAQARALKEAKPGLRGEGDLGSWRDKVNCLEPRRMKRCGRGHRATGRPASCVALKKFVAHRFHNKTFLLICQELKGISVFSLGSVATVLF